MKLLLVQCSIPNQKMDYYSGFMDEYREANTGKHTHR